MAKSNKQLHKRSDGWWEVPEGFFAVKMLRHSRVRHDGVAYLEFKTTPTAKAVRVEWDTDSVAQLFPEAVARTLVANAYARQPLDEEIEWLEEHYEAPKAAEAAPADAKKPTEPAAPPAPAAKKPTEAKKSEDAPKAPPKPAAPPEGK